MCQPFCPRMLATCSACCDALANMSLPRLFSMNYLLQGFIPIVPLCLYHLSFFFSQNSPMSHLTGHGVVPVTTPAPTDDCRDHCLKQLERQELERTTSESSEKFYRSDSTLSRSRSGDRVSRVASTLAGSQSHLFDGAQVASFNHSPDLQSPRSIVSPSTSDLSGDESLSVRDHGSIARTAGIDVEASQPLARDAFRRELGHTVIDTDYFTTHSPWSAVGSPGPAVHSPEPDATPDTLLEAQPEPSERKRGE